MPKIPDRFNESGLAFELSSRIAGSPANGSLAAFQDRPGSVIWVDAGDEVLVHLEALKILMLDGVLLVSVDLESDQTGRTPLIVSFALTNDPNDPAGLLCTTDEYPRGLGTLAARWGRPLQAALWAGLLSIAQDHAAQNAAAPQTIVVSRGSLQFHAGDPLKATGGPSSPTVNPQERDHP